MPKRPLRYRELIERLRPHGIVAMVKRGKGSEVILLKPDAPGSTKGAQYPIKHHGDGTEISIPVIIALLRRFGIDANSFWE
jgi:hypothetical protein